MKDQCVTANDLFLYKCLFLRPTWTWFVENDTQIIQRFSWPCNLFQFLESGIKSKAIFIPTLQHFKFEFNCATFRRFPGKNIFRYHSFEELFELISCLLFSQSSSEFHKYLSFRQNGIGDFIHKCTNRMKEKHKP